MSNDKKQTFKWVAPEDGSTETATFTSTDQARGMTQITLGKFNGH